MIMKVLTNAILLVGLALTFSSCEKMVQGELSMKRTDYTGTELRIDGYYYNESFVAPYPNYSIAKRFFYRNGIKFGVCSYDTTTMSFDEHCASLAKSKLNWYVFKIEGNAITIEGWDNITQTFKEYGEILNDTTFRIIEIERSERTEKSNIIYHFKQFSPKPDSTNTFIR